MNAQSKIEAADAAALTGLALLRAPFPEHHISKLPKETKSQIEARRTNKSLMVWKCPECGGPHHKDATHLDYVGHAALTDRLLDADPAWNWEPMAFNQDGSPAFDSVGGLWIRLTVCGQTRLGYGHAEGKRGGDAIKEVIGDALRNAAMRFGAALDLWHKGDLHLDIDDGPENASQSRNNASSQGQQQGGGMPDHAWAKLTGLLQATGTGPGVLCDHYKVRDLRFLSEADYSEAVERLETRLANMAREQTNQRNQSAFDAAAADDIPLN